MQCVTEHSGDPGKSPEQTEEILKVIAMGLFKPDFFRSLALGFLLGAAVMGVTAGSTALAAPSAELVSQ
ncbi:MAG: hypothetical protein ACO1OX_03520 [Novosphingobium sp.]